MPFSPDPKPGLSASSRACRAVIVARQRWPGSEWRVLSALQLAAGSPTELQGKSGSSDGAVRYSAPSLLCETADGRRLQAGGFQPVEAYDVVLTNLDPTLERPPEDVGSLLEYFAFGLTTQEVAALMTAGNDRPERLAAETASMGLVDEGRAERLPLGDDAVWTRADEHASDHRLTARALANSA